MIRAFCANSALPKGWGYNLGQGTLIARGVVSTKSCHTSIVRLRSKHGTARVEMEVLDNWSDIEEDSESEISESDEDESANEDRESDSESENWREVTGMYT